MAVTSSPIRRPKPSLLPALNGSALAIPVMLSQSVGGVSEMRVAYGPGLQGFISSKTGKAIVLLLCGGDKSTQEKNIKRAKEIAAEL